MVQTSYVWSGTGIGEVAPEQTTPGCPGVNAIASSTGTAPERHDLWAPRRRDLLWSSSDRRPRARRRPPRSPQPPGSAAPQRRGRRRPVWVAVGGATDGTVPHRKDPVGWPRRPAAGSARTRAGRRSRRTRVSSRRHSAHSGPCGAIAASSVATSSPSSPPSARIARSSSIVAVVARAHRSSSSNADRSRRMPSSVRLFTVPSGIPVAFGDARLREPVEVHHLDHGALLRGQRRERRAHRASLLGEIELVDDVRPPDRPPHLGGRPPCPRRGADGPPRAGPHRPPGGGPCPSARIGRILAARRSPRGSSTPPRTPPARSPPPAATAERPGGRARRATGAYRPNRRRKASSSPPTTRSSTPGRAPRAVIVPMGGSGDARFVFGERNHRPSVSVPQGIRSRRRYRMGAGGMSLRQCRRRVATARAPPSPGSRPDRCRFPARSGPIRPTGRAVGAVGARIVDSHRLDQPATARSAPPRRRRRSAARRTCPARCGPGHRSANGLEDDPGDVACERVGLGRADRPQDPAWSSRRTNIKTTGAPLRSAIRRWCSAIATKPRRFGTPVASSVVASSRRRRRIPAAYRTACRSRPGREVPRMRWSSAPACTATVPSARVFRVGDHDERGVRRDGPDLAHLVEWPGPVELQDHGVDRIAGTLAVRQGRAEDREAVLIARARRRRSRPDRPRARSRSRSAQGSPFPVARLLGVGASCHTRSRSMNPPRDRHSSTAGPAGPASTLGSDAAPVIRVDRRPAPAPRRTAVGGRRRRAQSRHRPRNGLRRGPLGADPRPRCRSCVPACGAVGIVGPPHRQVRGRSLQLPVARLGFASEPVRAGTTPVREQQGHRWFEPSRHDHARAHRSEAPEGDHPFVPSRPLGRHPGPRDGPDQRGVRGRGRERRAAVDGADDREPHRPADRPLSLRRSRRVPATSSTRSGGQPLRPAVQRRPFDGPDPGSARPGSISRRDVSVSTGSRRWRTFGRDTSGATHSPTSTGSAASSSSCGRSSTRCSRPQEIAKAPTSGRAGAGEHAAR